MRTGGVYKVDRKGNVKRVAKPTQDHTRGNRAREVAQKDQPTRVVEQPAKRGGK
jgi:hypothetical protein